MLKTLLNADVDEMTEDMRRYDREMHVAFYYPRVYWIYNALTVKLPAYFHRYITCRLFDHDIEMDSYATPDSGAEYWWCKRNCGHSGHHIYY